MCLSGSEEKHIFHSEAPLDLSFFSRIRDLMRSKKELFYDKYTPQIPADIDMSESIMKQVEQKDRFLFFPYDSMQPFLHMLNEAAEDPNVVSVKNDTVPCGKMTVKSLRH